MAKQKRQPHSLLGPILHFRGEQGDRWRVSALFLIEGDEEPHDLTVDGVRLKVPPRHIYTQGVRHIWRFDFAVPRGETDIRTGYGFENGERWYFTAPAKGALPRLAYTACNGVEDEAEIRKHEAPRNARWAHLNGSHRSQPYHLLLQGGDQLYADALWRDYAPLRAWRDLPVRDRGTVPFTPEMENAAEVYFFDLYLANWRPAEIAAMLSSTPSIMMWDDHDIFDGWGSHPEELQSTPVFQGIYAVARRCFALFQLGMNESDLPEAFAMADHGSLSHGYKIGDVGILVLDLRSERTTDRVMGPASWAALPNWLERFSSCRHLLLLSSVPVAFPNLNPIEKLLNLLPGKARFEDDLRDQWRSYAHESEWLRLVNLLGGFAQRTGTRVTILSGEIHFGASGVIRGAGPEIWQMTASGIVHPPPPEFYVSLLERRARGIETVADGITVEIPCFAETGRRFIRARNWLSIHFDERGALVGRWFAEGTDVPFTRIVDPLQAPL